MIIMTTLIITETKITTDTFNIHNDDEDDNSNVNEKNAIAMKIMGIQKKNTIIVITNVVLIAFNFAR